MGVDIDNALIDQCRTTVEHAFSLQKPLDKQPRSPNPAGQINSASVEQVGEPRRKKRKLKNGVAQGVQNSPMSMSQDDTNYFPVFFPQLLGSIDVRGATLLGNLDLQKADEEEGARQLPTDPCKQTGRAAFPRNLEFHAADWTNARIDTDETGYDVILGYVFPLAVRSAD